MAVNSQSANYSNRFTLGIALSGGGARGFAHAGALEAIEEAGHKPAILAGVSAGSVVAALYSAGLSPRRILKAFAEKKARHFIDFKPHNGGLLSIEPFKKFIEEHLGDYRLIEDLPIPTYFGATDFDHGRPVAFGEGEIAPRVAASCSIPIVFTPIDIDGTPYVDGGVLRNHPAWIIRSKCDYLIGVNVSPLESRLHEPANGLISVALRTYNLMAKANQASDMNMCDLNIVTTDIAHYHTFDLREIENIYLRGYAVARRALKDAGIWQQPLPISSKPQS